MHKSDNFVRSILCFALLILCGRAPAQTKQNAEPRTMPRPTNYQVLEEYKDKDGNLVRTIQYEQGNRRVRETQLIRYPQPKLNIPINPDTLNKDSVLVVVYKSRYMVEVFYKRKLIRAYKAVFGPKPQEDKCLAGDRCTPEGWFAIKNKNPNSKYDRFLLLDYPNDSSIARFNKLRDAGAIPKFARIGGDVGIHGIWKGGDDMIEKGVGWTDGCVALKNKDIEELFNLVAVGTRVLIKK